MKLRKWIFSVFIFLVAPLAANQDAIIVREAVVYSATNSASVQVGKIAAGTRVSVFDRKGGWKEVFYEQAAIVGWVRSYQVREGNFAPAVKTEATSDSRGFLSGLAAFSRKAAGLFNSSNTKTSSSTATIGVRGLSEAEINAARPDFEEFEKMQQFASNNARLLEFSRAGQLSVNNVPHLVSENSRKNNSAGGAANK
jgi:hypothetical protein